MTENSVTILQMVVLGLVITEWAVKIQQEKFTYQLITAMALDFFFAYDVIAFIMMSVDTQVFFVMKSWCGLCRYCIMGPVLLFGWTGRTGSVMFILNTIRIYRPVVYDPVWLVRSEYQIRPCMSRVTRPFVLWYDIIAFVVAAIHESSECRSSLSTHRIVTRDFDLGCMLTLASPGGCTPQFISLIEFRIHRNLVG